MITKDDLKSWLNESGRKKYEEKLEKFIDEQIKKNALEGKTTFLIPTGRWGNRYSERTPFYDIWFTEELTKENREIVHQRVIRKYKDFGFDVERTQVDCGWNNRYFALRFKDIDKVLEY